MLLATFADSMRGNDTMTASPRPHVLCNLGYLVPSLPPFFLCLTSLTILHPSDTTGSPRQGSRRRSKAHLKQLGIHQWQLDNLSQLAHLVSETADTCKRSRSGVFERHFVHLYCQLQPFARHVQILQLTSPRPQGRRQIHTEGSTSRGRIRIIVRVVISSETRTPALS